MRIGNLRYIASQSWPFPHSLMLGFHADYLGGEIVPQAEEIEDAPRWFLDRLPALPPQEATSAIRSSCTWRAAQAAPDPSATRLDAGSAPAPPGSIYRTDQPRAAADGGACAEEGAQHQCQPSHADAQRRRPPDRRRRRPPAPWRCLTKFMLRAPRWPAASRRMSSRLVMPCRGSGAGAGDAVVEAQRQPLRPLPAARGVLAAVRCGGLGVDQHVQPAGQDHHRQHLVEASCPAAGARPRAPRPAPQAVASRARRQTRLEQATPVEGPGGGGRAEGGAQLPGCPAPDEAAGRRSAGRGWSAGRRRRRWRRRSRRGRPRRRARPGWSAPGRVRETWDGSGLRGGHDASLRRTKENPGPRAGVSGSAHRCGE